MMTLTATRTIQYNCIMTFRIICIGVPGCPLNHIYFFSVRVLVMVSVRETLCDVVMSEY